VDALVSIGDFSARCGLSLKMLRTYSAIGLLTPAAIDKSSGYRYYAPSQVEVAKTIARLRSAGVSLAEIGRFLAEPSAAVIDRWEQELATEVAGRREALAEIRSRTAPAKEGPANEGPAKERQTGTDMTTLTTASATETGRVRPSNQDAVLVGKRVFAVADGFGSSGERASRLAVEALEEAFDAKPDRAGLVDAFRAANDAVWQEADADSDLVGMGTTLTAMGVSPGPSDSDGDGDSLTVVNIGDSRAYVLRNGELRRLTVDHSHVQQLVQAGELSPEKARAHPERAMLTKAVGIGPSVEADVVDGRCEQGDRFLLCTDGLCADLEDAEIGAVLSTIAGAEEAVAELVRLAMAGGGHDNVSVVVVDIG
jgi:serine/threonine protein phosphatase PrpC